jgi:hypothetical protein
METRAELSYFQHVRLALTAHSSKKLVNFEAPHCLFSPSHCYFVCSARNVSQAVKYSSVCFVQRLEICFQNCFLSQGKASE